MDDIPQENLDLFDPKSSSLFFDKDGLTALSITYPLITQCKPLLQHITSMVTESLFFEDSQNLDPYVHFLAQWAQTSKGHRHPLFSQIAKSVGKISEQLEPFKNQQKMLQTVLSETPQEENEDGGGGGGGGGGPSPLDDWFSLAAPLPSFPSSSSLRSNPSSIDKSKSPGKSPAKSPKRSSSPFSLPKGSLLSSGRGGGGEASTLLLPPPKLFVSFPTLDINSSIDALVLACNATKHSTKGIGLAQSVPVSYAPISLPGDDGFFERVDARVLAGHLAFWELSLRSDIPCHQFIEFLENCIWLGQDPITKLEIAAAHLLDVSCWVVMTVSSSGTPSKRIDAIIKFLDVIDFLIELGDKSSAEAIISGLKHPSTLSTGEVVSQMSPNSFWRFSSYVAVFSPPIRSSSSSSSNPPSSSSLSSASFSTRSDISFRTPSPLPGSLSARGTKGSLKSSNVPPQDIKKYSIPSLSLLLVELSANVTPLSSTTQIGKPRIFTAEQLLGLWGVLQSQHCDLFCHPSELIQKMREYLSSSFRDPDVIAHLKSIVGCSSIMSTDESKHFLITRAGLYREQEIEQPSIPRNVPSRDDSGPKSVEVSNADIPFYSQQFGIKDFEDLYTSHLLSQPAGFQILQTCHTKFLPSATFLVNFVEAIEANTKKDIPWEVDSPVDRMANFLRFWIQFSFLSDFRDRRMYTLLNRLLKCLPPSSALHSTITTINAEKKSLKKTHISLVDFGSSGSGGARARSPNPVRLESDTPSIKGEHLLNKESSNSKKMERVDSGKMSKLDSGRKAGLRTRALDSKSAAAAAGGGQGQFRVVNSLQIAGHLSCWAYLLREGIHGSDFMTVLTEETPTGRLKDSVDHFADLSFWTMTTIVRAASSSGVQCAETIQKFLQIAIACIALGDFDTPHAIITGIRHPAVARLEGVLSVLDDESTSSLKQLLRLFPPSRKNDPHKLANGFTISGYNNYREALSERANGPRSFSIPSVNILMEDLIQLRSTPLVEGQAFWQFSVFIQEYHGKWFGSIGSATAARDALHHFKDQNTISFLLLLSSCREMLREEDLLSMSCAAERSKDGEDWDLDNRFGKLIEETADSPSDSSDSSVLSSAEVQTIARKHLKGGKAVTRDLEVKIKGIIRESSEAKSELDARLHLETKYYTLCVVLLERFDSMCSIVSHVTLFASQAVTLLYTSNDFSEEEAIRLVLSNVGMRERVHEWVSRQVDQLSSEFITAIAHAEADRVNQLFSDVEKRIVMIDSDISSLRSQQKILMTLSHDPTNNILLRKFVMEYFSPTTSSSAPITPREFKYIQTEKKKESEKVEQKPADDTEKKLEDLKRKDARVSKKERVERRPLERRKLETTKKEETEKKKETVSIESDRHSLKSRERGDGDDEGEKRKSEEPPPPSGLPPKRPKKKRAAMADKVKDVDKKAIFPQVMEIEPYLDLFLDFLAEKEIEWLGRLWLALQKVLRSDEIDVGEVLGIYDKYFARPLSGQEYTLPPPLGRLWYDFKAEYKSSGGRDVCDATTQWVVGHFLSPQGAFLAFLDTDVGDLILQDVVGGKKK